MRISPPVYRFGGKADEVIGNPGDRGTLGAVKTTPSRLDLLKAERSRLRLPRHGSLRLAVGYPNRYWVAQSSLAYQRVVELAARIEGIAVDRFFADPHLRGRSLDDDTPLAELDVLAWSCSFELDAVGLVRTLDDAGIPRRSADRGQRFPLLVMGGAVANINPLPLASVIDVFVMGAAELLWPQLIEKARDLDRGDLLREALL